MELISREDIDYVYAPIAPIIKGESVHYEYIAFKRQIEELQPVDAQPVVHGEWIIEHGDRETGYGGCIMCSECSANGALEWDFCPMCGARMDGADIEEE